MKHVPFKTALSALLMAGTTFSALADAPAAGSAPKNPAHVEITLRPGNYRSIGEADLFIPLFQDTMRMFFADLRVVRDTKKNTEGNFGLGYRHIMNNRYILGVYGFYDVRRTRLKNTFQQVTAGLEVMTCNYEARVNGYFPVTKKKLIKRPSSAGFVGNIVGTVSQFGQQFETALMGFDAEVGARIPTPGFKNLELRVFGGGYYFKGKNGSKNVTGPRGRVEARFNEVFTPGSRITVGFEVSHDKRIIKESDRNRGRTHFFGQFGIRIPLQWKSMRVATGLQRRLAEYVKRDVDIVTNSAGRKDLADGDLTRAVNAAIGKSGNIIKAFHVNPTKATANTAVAADKRDGTFEKPFGSIAELQTFFANSANLAGVNVSDIAIIFPAGQTLDATAVLQIDALATDNKRSQVFMWHDGGPDELHSGKAITPGSVKLHQVNVVNGVATKTPGKSPFDGVILRGVKDAKRPIVRGGAAGVFTSTNVSFDSFGVDATANNNAASVINVNWTTTGGTFTGSFGSGNITGSATSVNGLNVTTANNVTGTFNVDSANATGFTVGNAFNFLSGGSSNLTGSLNAVQGNTSNYGLMNRAQGTSTLSVKTDGKSVFNNNTTGGINFIAEAGTKGNLALNNTTVDTTTFVGADALTNTFAGVRVEAQGAGTTITFKTDGLTVNNAMNRGVLVLTGAGATNTTRVTLDINKSTFSNNQRGALNTFVFGSGLSLQASDGNAVTAGLITGTVKTSTFSSNTGAGLSIPTRQSTTAQTVDFTGNTFTTNNTANTAFVGDVLIATSGALAGGAVNNVFNFTDTKITTGSNAASIGFSLGQGGNGGLNTVNWTNGTITGNAGAAGGLLIQGDGVTAKSARFNMLSGQITGFTNGVAGLGYGVLLRSAAAADTAVFSLGTSATAGTGAGQTLISGNSVGIHFGTTAPVAQANPGSLLTTTGATLTTAAGLNGNAATLAFFTPNTAAAVD